MPATLPIPTPTVRRAIRVRGLVQGVGFRPFVWRLARDLSVSGWVRNDAQGVAIEVQGDAPALERFMARLACEAPRLARIDRIEACEAPVRSDAGFEIAASRGGDALTGIAADTAVCDACLAELFDPRDRRYRYPFINCTQCGPRFTITGALPYDRASTSMARFALCGPCRAEFDDPADRRFHAQPNACAACGPSLALLDRAGTPLETTDVVTAALARLQAGEIVAVKGLGGFHLACDARNREAVAALRARKSREEKPLAVMVAGVASMEGLAYAGVAERALLESRERPIVLLRKGRACDASLHGVAPGVAWLGAMLPYTPVQYLLFHEAAGRPEGTNWLAEPQPLVLVMTSANPGGEPLVTGNAEALERLAGIADAFVTHNRDILVRCDDSVTRATSRGPAFIRRARGYTPAPIRLAAPGPSVLAVGGFLKNTVCATRGEEAFLSQHIGDLDNGASCRALEEAAFHLLDVLGISPQLVAHDLHPDFHSTRFAAGFASAHGIPAIGIQHHHAHVAAVAAEHGVRGPLLGLALDGVGLGTDGRAWGGELLRVEGGMCERLGHLRELALPGGDRAARAPWRMAAAALHAMGRGEEIVTRLRHPAAATVSQMLKREFNSPRTSSAGRWFDAAAGLLGVREACSFEGQAAMLLEGLAARHGAVEALADGYDLGSDGVLDLLPLLANLAQAQDAGYGAALFHATLARALAEWVAAAAGRTGLSRVAFGGGCFVNHVLSNSLRANLERSGLSVLEARAAPANDGGLAFGQAAAAMARG